MAVEEEEEEDKVEKEGPVHIAALLIIPPRKVLFMESPCMSFMENTIYTEYFSNPCTSSLRPHESSRLDVFCQLEEVNECLPPADYQIPAEEVAKRTDFRKLCIFSIDPPGSAGGGSACRDW